MAYFENKEFQLAVDDANKSIEMDPNFVKGHYRKGMFLFEMGNVQEVL
jgi:hypothetical protein